MNESKLSYQHNKRTMAIFCLSFALSAIPLFGRVDTAIIVIALLCIIIRISELRNLIKPHPSWIPKLFAVNAFGIIIFLLVSHGFRTYLVNAFIDLLISGIALKFLEQSNERDRAVHGVALIFLSSMPFIFYVEWYMIFYMVLTAAIDFSVLMTVFGHSNKKNIFHYCLKLVLCAAPLAALIFFVLPRFNPFWQMPAQETAKTGLGDSITFNSIENLIQDNSVAFRVNFDGQIPAERYFAAMRYPQYNQYTGGFEESRYQKYFEESLTFYSRQPRHKLYSENFISGIVYHLYLEPSQRRWIPALEPSVAFNDQIIYSPMGTWLDRLPITQGRYFKFKYVTDPQEQKSALNDINPYGQSIFLGTGQGNLNPETRAFVNKIKNDSSSDEEFIRKILNYFSQEGFRYTLNPVQINPNSRNIFDEFLFRNRNGFCNHYSAATAYMLRLAGIPTMVMGGYLGGTINEDEHYVTVRNSDAHSWVMAFIKDHWIRIDPVTAIAPERIEKSYADLQPKSEMSVFSPERYQDMPIISWFRNKIDELEFQWTRLILNYNFDNEEGFLSRFFSENALLAAIFLIIAFTSAVYITLLIAKLLKRNKSETPLQKEIKLMIQKLSQINIIRKNNETLKAFFTRVESNAKTPELANIINELSTTSEEVLYSNTINLKEALYKIRNLKKKFLVALKNEAKIRKNTKLHF